MEAGLSWVERKSDSDFIASIWTCSATVQTMHMVLADPCFSIALVHVNDQHAQLDLVGPKTEPFYMQLSPGYSCTAIRLKPGVFLKGFSPQKFINSSLSMPVDAMSQFRFQGTQLQFPDFEHAELLVDRLHELGYLGYASRSFLRADNRALSRKHTQLVKRVTGLSPYQLYQLQRMHQVLRLLKQGVPAAKVASDLAFVDQSHLIRASKRFLGHTPKRLPDLPQAP